jgi:hypothetical protein
MFGRIILIAVIAAIGYLSYTNPKFEDHKAFLIDEIQQTYPVPDEMQERLWKDVDYSNFIVCSFVKTSEESSMISSGFIKKVKLVDTKWVDEVKTKLASMEERYY